MASHSPEFESINQAFGVLTQVDIHQLNAVCAENSRPDGDRSAIVEMFKQQLDTLGELVSAAPPNIELARKAGDGLDRAARSLLRIYGSKLAEMESYFPGLTEEVRTRVLGRAEYWKGVALLNALHTITMPLAQDAGSSPTATPAQLQAQPTAESTGAASEAPAPPQPEAASKGALAGEMAAEPAKVPLALRKKRLALVRSKRKNGESMESLARSLAVSKDALYALVKGDTRKCGPETAESTLRKLNVTPEEWNAV